MAGLQLKIRLREGPDDDLLAWYRALPDSPYGVRTEMVRQMIRAGLAKGAEQSDTVPCPGRTGPGLDRTVQCSPAADLMAELLPAIREVVEATVETALARMQFVGPLPEPAGADDETDELLDEIGAGLVLEDDDF